MSDFISYNDFINANAGNADATLQTMQGQQTAPDYSAAYKAGKTGGAAPTNPSASYGDFLKGLTGPDAGASAMLGGSNPYDSFALAGASPSAVQQAQGQFDQQQRSLGDVYAAGAKNADTAGAKSTMDAFNASQFNEGQGHMTPEEAKQAQKDSLAAGAKYRLDKERKAYEADQKNNQFIENGVASILNPAYGLGWASTDFGHGHSTDFSRTVEDPFGLGGDAHSGFGPGGKFGSPLGMGSSAQGDPLGQYDPGDTGFQEWLKKQGYDPNTGNGNGY